MKRSKPLSYLSLKCVIPYMSVHFRVADAACFPSLRSIQMKTPLRLKNLTLNESNVEFDDLHYFFSVIKEIPNQEGWQPVYSYDRAFYDVDPYGRKDTTRQLMPGDIFIRNNRQQNEGEQNGWMFNAQRRPQTYKSYVQCDILRGLNVILPSVRSQYGIKMRDSIRKQMDKILGGRLVHQVNHLKIKTSYGILRLPEGLKLEIRELTVQKNGNNVIEAIRPILDASSFPLKSLSVQVQDTMDPVFQNEILRTSESLNLDVSGLLRHEWANLVMNLPNKSIHICYNEIVLDSVFAIAKNWIENSRSIGSKFSMRSKSVSDNLNKVKNELQAVEGYIPEKEFPLCYSLPMNSTSEMNFYGCKSPNYDYIFVMEVMPIGTFIPDKK